MARRIRPKDEKILRELSLCRFLTIRQVKTGFFGRGSYTHVSTFLKSLASEKYLACIEPAAQNQPYLYGLAKKGVSYLRSTGADLSYYPSEHAKLPSSMHLAHLLTTNDIMIALARLAENEPDIELFDRRHYLTTPQKNRTAIPDAWAHLVIQQTHLALWFEVDRGTEEREYIKRKTGAIVDFALRGYLEEFAVPLQSIAFITTASIARLDQLIRWVAEEIPENMTAYFHLSYLPSDSDPLELLVSPAWRRVDGAQVSLLR